MVSCSEKLKAKNLLGSKDDVKDGESSQIAAKTFTFRELAAAARNFRGDCLLGEGGFGRVYKGRLDSNQVFFCYFFFSMMELFSTMKRSSVFCLHSLVVSQSTRFWLSSLFSRIVFLREIRIVFTILFPLFLL